MNSSTVAAFVSMMHSISTFPAASLTAIEVLAWCTSMPIYYLLSIWVLLSVGSEPTPPAYAERGALFYNALTGERGKTGHTAERGLRNVAALTPGDRVKNSGEVRFASNPNKPISSRKVTHMVEMSTCKPVGYPP